MTEWIRTAGKAITPNFQMAFTFVRKSGSGYMFDYDPVTKQVECKSDIARENVTAQHEKSILGKTSRKTSTRPFQTDSPCF